MACPFETSKCKGAPNLRIVEAQAIQQISTLPTYASSVCFWNLSAGLQPGSVTNLDGPLSIIIRVDEISQGDAYFVSNASFDSSGQLAWGTRPLYTNEIIQVQPSERRALQYDVSEMIIIAFRSRSRAQLGYLKFSFWVEARIPPD
jgi:hypothetical protein